MTNARDTKGLEGATDRRPVRRAAVPGLAAALMLALTASLAAPAGHATEQKPTVPRFASLRHNKVHMRAGPGTRFPIRWVYRRRGLPIEILRDYGIWRYLRDPWGTKGWVHVRNLTSKRTVLVTGRVRALRAEPSEKAPPVARVEPTVIGRLERCERDWCRLSVGQYTGWLRRRDLWGVYRDETVR